MKKSELKQIIKEELSRLLEAPNYNANNNTVSKDKFEAQAQKFLKALQDAKNKQMTRDFPGSHETVNKTTYSIDKGRNYWRIVANGAGGSRSVYCFLDTRNGDILKAAGWKAPAKHPRGNIFDKNILGGLSPYGADYIKGPKVGEW